ncbi:MAG: diguanylate cyclase [Rhodobacterales bacterium]|nr:MAG: diguanylate cyclase [Rhodobacterales bacterium]
MARASGIKSGTRAALIHDTLAGPQVVAFLPALMLGTYWFGGEGLLLTAAVIFPALFAFLVVVARREVRAAGRDPVTGLPGRESLIDVLEHSLMATLWEDAGARVALVIEIDGFSRLRDQFGEDGTEAIRRQAADRLIGVLREGDMVAALGPGLFGLALAKTPRVDLETMIQLSSRMQDALADPISLDGARILVTASVGFALPARVEDQTGEALLAAAESALDEARKAGPGAVRAYARGMPPRITVPDDMTREVVRALDNGGIRPWFQPQISTDTGALTGFEALARWQHPERGMISPGAFLPAIARGGLYDRLGEVMLYQSLTALRDWDRAGFDVPGVSVNFSADELRNPRLFDKVRWELDRFDLPPSRLTVEILEDVVARSEDDTTTRNIAALSRLGCPIDLDDFGTGHASIANIRRFDVNRIKIDRSFITHVDTDRDQQNMVAAILMMAERLGLETLGEGVESHGEHAMLAQLGCGHVQGYSIARPMPLSETIGWMTAHRDRLAGPPGLPRQTG